MTMSDAQIRRVSATYTLPQVTVDLLDASKPDDRLVDDQGRNAEHVVGAEMVNRGSLRSNWRYVGTAGPNDTACDALSYVPAEIPWGTTIAGRGIASGIACRFDQQYFYAVTGLGGDWSPRHLRACRDLWSLTTRSLLDKIYNEVKAPGFASDILISSMAHIILVDLARYFRNISDDGDVDVGGRLSAHHLFAIKQHVETSEGKRISIADIATMFGYSEGHFHNIFKLSTGMTPHGFVETVRIKKALHLLSDEQMNIKQVAYKTGFSGPSSFSTAFRKYTGTTPAQFQRDREMKIRKPNSGNQLALEILNS